MIKNPVPSDKLVTISKSDRSTTKSAPLFVKAEIKGKQNNNGSLNNPEKTIQLTEEIGESIVSNADSTITTTYSNKQKSST